ncbi:MAG TPA: agmatine deiminase family protein, partial [Prolixibacteraceae bacterium]|nr:agmatine deiminase family protein [Prolixibacteraceae bacterium]
MTPEEEGRKDEIGRNFLKSAALTGEVRNVAEFERMEGVLVRYPLGLPTSFIAAMSKHTVVYTLVSSTTNENSARSAYQSAGATLTNCKFIRAATDSYWTRDYGPWYVMNESNQMCIVDFPYDRPRANDDAVNGIVGSYLNIPVYNMPVVHTGGNYMTDGWGISASTDLVYEENSNNVAWVNQ